MPGSTAAPWFLAILTAGASLLGVVTWERLHPGAAIRIDVEHTAPLTLDLRIVQKGNSSMVTIGHDAEERISLRVPSSWERREVRGTPLSALIADAPVPGFRRLALPSMSSVTFATPTSSVVIMHHTSAQPLSIRMTVVDLRAGSVFSDVRLLQEESTTLPLSPTEEEPRNKN